MNYKNLLFPIILLISITSSISTYTKDPSPSKKSVIESSSQEEFNDEQEISCVDSIPSKELLQFNAAQQAEFDIIKQQTNIILSCLQQLEQVLATDKIKFDSTKISKKELLKEIDEIKSVIIFYNNLYTTEQAIFQGSITGIIFNKVCIDYLLPLLKNDISTMSCESFDNYIAAYYRQCQQNVARDVDSINTINIENHMRIEELKIATDNVGLTFCNKTFRYLQDVPMSLTGVPLMTTIKNTAFGLSLGALIYTIATYAAPKDYDINLGYIHINTNQIPFKACIGSQELTRPAMQSSSLIASKQFSDSFGIGNYIERTYRESTDNPLTMIGIGYAMTNTQSLYKSAVEYSQEICDSMNSYLRGEISKGKGLNKQHNNVYFHDMINAKELEAFALELADYMKYPTRYENSGTAPSTGILLKGPSQTGKSYYAQAVRTLIDQELKKDGHHGLKFWDVTKEDIEYYGIPYIFRVARHFAPCILFFDEIDMLIPHRDIDKKIAQEILTNMSGLLNDKNKKVIVIAATNVPDQLDKALLQNGRIGKQFQFELPSFQHRKDFLLQSLSKKNIKTLSMVDIDMIAHETEGETYNTLSTIIATAIRFSIFKSRLVTKQDFQDALDTDLRHIRKNTSLTDNEKKIIAIYQSGQAAARHILSTAQEVIKITINTIEKQAKGTFRLEKPAPIILSYNQQYTSEIKSKNIKNGGVFTLNLKNKDDFLDDQDHEHELLAILAGQAALELTTGKNFSNFQTEDRAKILQALEIKISQGNSINDDTRKQAIAEKDILYKKIKDILTPHLSFISMITDKLLQHNSIDRQLWAQLTDNYRI